MPIKTLIDLTGKRFERLLVLERAEDYVPYNNPSLHLAQWRCLCDCGNEVIVLGQNLRRGATRSCGCLRRELAGKARQRSKTVMRYD